jgi:uncharacterized sulfatase
MLTSIVFLPLYFFVKLPVSSNFSINKSTFIYTSILKDWWRKTTGEDPLKVAEHYQKEFPDRKYIHPDYPFLHRFENKDHLSEYLTDSLKNPNLVICIVEGLSDEFLHPVRGISFMPYLDSLSQQSLYWDHFFSNGERSFAVTPSLIGSLPFGSLGFALLDQYPYHFSLVNIFRQNNYYTSFYYGQGAWFHGKEPFYRFNNIDQIIDKNHYDPSLEKVFIGEEKHFWGYNDIDLFKQYFIVTDSLKKEKRLDIFFTGTSHAPFDLKYPEYYHQLFEENLKTVSNAEDRVFFEKYSNYFCSLYNVDDAIRNLIETYKTRPDFNRSIFIITGDHPMTEIHVDHKLKKYHVPLIIYSPALKKHAVFHGWNSHLDIYESILSYYQNQAQFKVPEYSTALGMGLSFSEHSDYHNNIPIMNDNRQINDFLIDGYYISEDNTLFKVMDNLEIKEYYDIKNWNRLYKKLRSLRAASLLSSDYKMLMPDTCYFNFFDYHLLHKSSREASFLLNKELILADSVVFNKKELFIDIEFTKPEHPEFIPICILRFNEIQNNKPVELIYELKSNHENCQFHLPVTVPFEIKKYSKLSLITKDKQNRQYNLAKMILKIYE